MRATTMFLFGAALMAPAGYSLAAPEGFPSWAYPPCIRTPPKEPAENVETMSVPGSNIHNSDAAAYAYCHLPDGSGRPENARLTGLSSSYIFAQARAVHTGDRQSAKRDWPPTALMRDAIANLTDAQILEAAEYFSRQKSHSFVRVLEREFTPAHKVGCGIFLPDTGPVVGLKSTIVEMPIDAARFEVRDPHTAYIAYVPKGSTERGRKLAITGDEGRTLPCRSCHGLDLRSGPDLEGPPLAGRFATYLFRQLYGFQSGARAGDIAQPMRTVVAQLTQSDMIDLAAYAASLKP